MDTNTIIVANIICIVFIHFALPNSKLVPKNVPCLKRPRQDLLQNLGFLVVDDLELGVVGVELVVLGVAFVAFEVEPSNLHLFGINKN
jgi:hypothetical protein